MANMRPTFSFTFTCTHPSGDISYTPDISALGGLDPLAWPETGKYLPDDTVREHSAQLRKEADQILSLRERKFVPVSVLAPFLNSCIELSKKFKSPKKRMAMTPVSTLDTPSSKRLKMLSPANSSQIPPRCPRPISPPQAETSRSPSEKTLTDPEQGLSAQNSDDTMGQDSESEWEGHDKASTILGESPQRSSRQEVGQNHTEESLFLQDTPQSGTQKESQCHTVESPILGDPPQSRPNSSFTTRHQSPEHGRTPPSHLRTKTQSTSARETSDMNCSYSSTPSSLRDFLARCSSSTRQGLGNSPFSTDTSVASCDKTPRSSSPARETSDRGRLSTDSPTPSRDDTARSSSPAREASSSGRLPTESPDSSPQKHQNRITDWYFVLKNADSHIIRRMKASFKGFRKRVNRSLKLVEGIAIPEEYLVSGVDYLENGNIRLYFPNADVRDLLAASKHKWSHEFGRNVSVIVQTYDVAVANVKRHDSNDKDGVTNPMIKELLDLNRSIFPSRKLPYIHNIQWLDQKKRKLPLLLIEFYNAEHANRVIRSGIRHKVNQSAPKSFRCSRYRSTEPVQCTGCWQYDHTEFDCFQDRCCVFCGGSHDGSDHSQSDETKCVLCGRPHAATSPNCSVRKRAKQQCGKEPDYNPFFPV
ncbi:hypothetical protein AJ79_06730 [Helicocarpus griseus UAMH5409]|uniref:Uncharacterized protein n=1 Tax=Helicocarpus griseus UAMH5409 TaxID=1447875 RepID=A0A2B7X250_9EURO|nr:hypothetical protein AJ79_06730 [Helicocarpus griseus UAMH5409]